MLPTIIVASVIALILFGIIFAEVRNKRNGKSSCSCGSSCGGCSMNGTCHSKK